MSVNGTYFLYCFAIISSTCIVSFSEKIRQTNHKGLSKIVFWLSIIMPLLVAANRYGIGTDYFNYMDMYNSITSDNNIMKSIINYRSIEPGWIILNYMVKYIFDDYKYVFIISSFFTLFFSFKAIYNFKDKINLGLSMFIFMCTLYLTSFNIIRQSLAVAIVFFGYKYIEEKKVFKYLLFMCLAICFHYSALVFLPMYWFLDKKITNTTRIKKYILYAAFIVFIMYFNTLINSVANMSENLSRYSEYNSTDNIKIAFSNIINKLPILIIIFLNIKNLRKMKSFISESVSLYYLAVLLTVLAPQSTTLGRICMYFQMSQIIILPAIVKNQKKTGYKNLIIVLIILYFATFWVISYILNNYGGTVPYITL